MRKVLLAASLLCVALLFASLPAVSVGAQGNGTATPMIIVVTATPIGGSGDSATAEATADTAIPTSGDDVPTYIQAIRATYPVLGKKISRNSNYIKANLAAYTYDAAAQVKECKLKDGEKAPLAGDVYGWLLSLTFYNKNSYTYFVTYDLKTVFECTAGTVVGSSNTTSSVLGKAVPGALEVGAHIYDWSPVTVGRVTGAKMKWIKRQFQVGEGGGATGAINAAHASGLKILMAVVGNKNDLYTPGYIDHYAQYVGSLAQAGADAIEVWNEMNLDREWPNGKISPADYTNLLKKSYAAIKAGGNTMVISGALAPTGAAGPGGKTDAYWNDDVYYNEMAAAGAAQYMDCVGLHYNEGIVSPNQSTGDPRDNYPTRYFGTMLNRALAPFPGMKACFTEIGFLSPEGYPPLPGGFSWAQNVTVAQQAQWIAEAAVKASQLGNVRLMIVWNLDFVRYDSDPQAGYALVRTNGTCPGCDKLASVLP